MRTIKSKVLSLLAVLCSGMAFAAQVDNGVKTVFIPESGSTKVVSLSSEAGAWTAESADDGIATITPANSPSGDVVTNTITAVGAAGTCTTCTVSNASAKWTYNVRIDNHTLKTTVSANFARELVERTWTSGTAGSSQNWVAWSDDPDLAEVRLEDLNDKGNAGTEITAERVMIYVTNMRKKAGKTTVYVENDTEYIVFNVTVQTISDVSVPLRHCEDEADPRGFYTVTEILPDAGASTDNPDSWGYDYAYSTDESIAKIRIVDGKFEIYNPVGDDGRDGNARVFFIKDTTDVMENDAKIWIFDVSASTVEIEKYLTFKADKKAAETNATLNIRTHFLHNVKEVYTNKVLFVGTGCSSHSLERTTIVESIQAIQEKADVDVYLYRGDGNNSGFKGTFTKGGTKFADSDIGLTLAGNMHGCLTKFYNLFYDIAMNEDTRYKYDYIVMEFDGQRLGSHDDNDNYQPNENRDKVVAEWLNEYYEGAKDSETARVIWIVDDQAVSSGTYPITIHYQESNRVEGVDYFFRPFQANISGSGNVSEDNETHGLNDVRFRGLIGLLNPWTYLNHDLYRYSGTALTAILDEVCPKVHYIIGNNVDKFVHTGETYIHQAYYNNKDNLVDYLKNHITDTTYGAAISDDVETQGLQFVEGTLKMFGSYDKAAVTGGDPSSNSNWKAMNKVGTSYVAAGLDPTGTVLVAANHSITGHLDNIVREYWNLIQIDLVDADGSFRAGAKYDETLGKFVRDPNLNTNELDHTQGKAAYAYFYDTMWPDRGVDDEGETLWDWEFEKLPLAITAAGVTRVYDGTGTNATVVSVKSGDTDVTGATITAMYSANGTSGWSDPEIFEQEKFVNVTNLYVKLIAYKDDFYFTATSTPVQVQITNRTVYLQAGTSTNKYNAAMLLNGNYTELSLAQAKVATPAYMGADNAYGFVSGEGVSSVTMTSDSKVKDVADCPKANKIDTVTLNDETDAGNYNIVKLDGELVVTPLTITVTADDKSKTYGAADPAFTWTRSGPDAVPAADTDRVNTELGKSQVIRKDYPTAATKNKAGTYTYVLDSNDVFKVDANYIVNFVPGNFTINPKKLVVTATAKTFVYDGQEHTIGLSINYEADELTGDEMYVSFETNGVWTTWKKWSERDQILPKAKNVADTMTIGVKAATVPPDLVTGMSYTPGYSGKANYTASDKVSAKLTITKRPITLSTKSVNVTVPYNEIADFEESEIKDATAGKSKEGYVNGEKFDYTNLAKNSTAGTTKKASFKYVENATILENNYKVTCIYGKLTVRPKPAPASDCGYLVPTPEETAWAYQWKFTGKTTKAIGFECDCGTAVTRASASLKIQGWSFYCEPGCGDFEAMEADEIFWQVKPAKVLFDSKSGVSFEVANVIGKKGKDYETSGRANFAADGVAYRLAFAGLGKYDSKNVRVSSVKGNFAGFAVAPRTIKSYNKKSCGWSGSDLSKVWGCGDLCPTTEADSVAFGKWTVKFHKTNAKKYANSKLNERKLIPSWAR